MLDKPRGPSSHEISAYVKKLLGARKAGHAGTLDPQVSGVLVIGLNRATRLLRFAPSGEKTYVGVMRLEKRPQNILQLQKAGQGPHTWLIKIVLLRKKEAVAR